MTSELPTPPELVSDIRGAMDSAHSEWAGNGWPSGRRRTRVLTRHVWQLGFELDVVGLYPMTTASSWDEAEQYARTRLEQRSAHMWPIQHEREHSPLTEFQYDVTWAYFDREYREMDF